MTRMASRLVGLLMVLGMLAGSAACTRIGPGYAGIKISNAGDDRGVDSIPRVTGWVFYMPGFTQVLEYPTFVQTDQWAGPEGFTFGSKEGMQFGADINVSYAIQAAKVPEFYVKFRTDDLSKFTHGYLRNVAKDVFNAVGVRYTTEELYGIKKEEFINTVKADINKLLEPQGVGIDQFGILGALRLPPAVVGALNSKIEATQIAMRVENELRTTQAEAQKHIALAEGQAKAQIAAAEGQAKANRIINDSISPNLLTWEQLKIQQRWNGQLPTVTGGSIPFVSIPTK